jgi:signal transduction histidine kinase
MAKIRTRARAVDMLGRQQIAGIQNALSELFKNAHDAYAMHAVVDFFEDTGTKGKSFIVIRDDGVGMTRSDFEDKWLVLGTESKTGEGRRQLFRPKGMEPRPITGEKGIGRLAIALLGEQVLILTRAIREDGHHDLVASLIHWGLFEISGVNLEDIDVPIATFPGGTLPTVEDITELQSQLRAACERIESSHEGTDLTVIKRQIDTFLPDPQSLESFFRSRDSEVLSLSGEGSGTHFFVGPSNPVIRVEIEAEARADDYSFRKQMLGFCDPVFGSDGPVPIATSFRHWRLGDLLGEELLDPATFFSKEELKRADHRLEGEIDEFGQFRGSLRVYDQNYEDVIIPWPEAKGERTHCGPFSVTFGYLMGRSSETLLSPEEYKLLNRKLDYLGGMYVYRDRIRILPYGDHSFDWLEVEKRRNKGAGYYFFSFRRMFGAVLLSRDQNSELKEKAGREGFQQNEAYRHLRDILTNLLIQLAAEFFRPGGSNTALFEQTQSEVRRRSAALERQQKRSLTKRKNFANALTTFHHEVNTGLPDAAISNLRKLTQSRMKAASEILDQDKAATALIRAEQEALGQLTALRTKYTQKRPAGVALTKELARDWDGYVIERTRLEEQVFGPFEQEVSRTLGSVAQQARVYIDQRKRLEERIKALANERKRELEEASRQVNATASDTRQTVLNISEKARLALDQTIRNIQADLNRTDLSILPPEQIEEMRRRWEEELTEIEERHRDALMAARDMLASLAENLKSSDGEEPAQIMEALEQRMISLEEQAEDDFEMVQLGLAVAIINHEFSASIKRVRRSVQELGHISRKTSSLRPLYESIRSNFEHLDGHLNLFTPLQRRLHRSAQRISGKSIRNYITDLFSNRFERHKVRIDYTEAFLLSNIECYPSTLYPAVINLIDNAVFWLTGVAVERVIRLDADSDALLISNNGPSIEPRDWQRIFDRGFSRKPEGRGLGLFISAKALQAEGMGLSLQDPSSDMGVAFRIAVPNLTFSS